MVISIKVGDTTHDVTCFVHKKVGNTENMKFSVANRNTGSLLVFDDLSSIMDYCRSIIEDGLEYIVDNTY